METQVPAGPYPAQRYRLDFTVERPLHLPEYAGSALRGLFGHALRHVACVTGAAACPPCPLYRSCPYPAIFDTPPPADARRVYTQVPHPYIVEPPPWGERGFDKGQAFDFHVVLVGTALAQLPLVLAAWRRALAGRVGPADGAARLERAWAEGDELPVLDGAAGRLRVHAKTLPPAPLWAGGGVAIEFVTPLRLTRDGHTLGVDLLAPHDLLMSLLRRVASLTEIQQRRPLAVDFAALNRAAQRIRGRKALHWIDWTRRSARQRQSMTVGGVLGRWALEGDDADLAAWWPLLHLGQWLHVGKLASFGLGQYRLSRESA